MTFEEVMSFLHERSVRDEDCGCLIWKGAFSHGVCKMRTINLREGRTTNVRRLILSVRSSTPLKKNELATSKCGNPRCVEPEHVRRITRADLQKRTSMEGKWRAAHVIAARKLQGKKVARITPEVAREIRDRVNSGQTGRQVAVELGFSQSSISKVMNGQIGAKEVPNASVFSWRPAA